MKIARLLAFLRTLLSALKGFVWELLRYRVPVILVGEGPRCYALAEELLFGSTNSHLKLVGWVLDSKRMAANRFQSFGQFPRDREECEQLASRHSIPVFNGSIHTEEFECWFEQREARLVLMAGFGEKVREHQIAWVNRWWLNTHPAPLWPSPEKWRWPNEYRGAQPYQGMLRDKVRDVAIVLHGIDEQWDEGTYITQSMGFPMGSWPTPLATDAEVAGFLSNMHMLMSKPTAWMIRDLARKIKYAIWSGVSVRQFARAVISSESPQREVSASR